MKKLPVLNQIQSLLWGVFLYSLLLSGNCTRVGSSHLPPEHSSIDTLLPVENQGLDTFDYHQRLNRLANGDKTGRWPAKGILPAEGALLPFQRIIAYYGNFYCKQMGILGEYTPTIVIKKLEEQALQWREADSLTPVVPAIHYIAVTAQSSACDGYYRLRMPEKEILKAVAMADTLQGLVFLDIQVGLSTLEKELPLLEKYFKRGNVHLGIDPEFSMKTGKKPGSSIGTFDAADINYASAFLARIVEEYKLPPKVLIVHRFTAAMLTNYKQIDIRPQVQVVINMDGFGSPELKKNSYRYFIYRQPVQFAGLKVFYKNDVTTGGRIMTPEEILHLQPQPVYIQYQ